MPKKLLYGKRTKGVIRLPEENTIYVPATNRQQKNLTPAGRRRRVDAVRKYLSNKFGGYTSVKSTGGWVMRNGRLVKEPIVKVTAFATKKDFEKHKPAIKRQVKKWGQKWGQEAMSYEYEGDLYIVNTPRPQKKKVAKKASKRPKKKKKK